jgi:predicted Rdx family selenoprotein
MLRRLATKAAFQRGMATKVHIERCNVCGGIYTGVLLRLQDAIEETAPEAVVTSSVGRLNSFEVTVDGKFMAASKKATGNFPDVKTVAKQVLEYGEKGKVPDSWTELPEGERERVGKMMETAF